MVPPPAINEPDVRAWSNASLTCWCNRVSFSFDTTPRKTRYPSSANVRFNCSRFDNRACAAGESWRSAFSSATRDIALLSVVHAVLALDRHQMLRIGLQAWGKRGHGP